MVTDQAIERYLRAGESDPYLRTKSYVEQLRTALLTEVQNRAGGRTHPPVPDLDLVAFTRQKVAPMVRGLFPRAEQPAVIQSLERSVVLVTAENIENLITSQTWDRSAWSIANLYLHSLGADLLSELAPSVLGLSEEQTCYVSALYFEQNDPFADYIVHEAAHVFHNCKRETLGLRATRTREWLLPIAFRKREAFALSCEAYSRILERAATPAQRQSLAGQLGSRPDDVFEEVAEIVREASQARNGWKVILAHCSER